MGRIRITSRGALALPILLLAAAPAGADPDFRGTEQRLAQTWKRAPWNELEKAARRIDRQGRKAAREILRGDAAPAPSKGADEPDRDERAREEAPRAAPRGERPKEPPDEIRAAQAPPPGEEAAPSLWGRLALVVLALAGAAGGTWAELERRRRRTAEPSGVATLAAPSSTASTLAAPPSTAATRAAPAAPPDAQATLAAPVAPPRAPGARTFGEGPRYEILERIGAGGMGVVYRARDRRLSREVALKRLSEQLIDHPKAVRYFLREARSVAGLSHPNIVTLYDVDEEDGVPFLTMELLEGRNLSQLVAADGPLSSADTASLGAQAAQGLACAHRQGIVHRDVKSANLFLTRTGAVKVMDFGLATMAEELRRAGTVMGTPQYMAPEQARGGAADHRVDLYALGVTLFHLATGTWPFEEGDVLHHHRHTPAPDPRSRRSDLAPPLAELILACLAKEPDKRPATADDVAERLQAVARGGGAPLGA